MRQYPILVILTIAILTGCQKLKTVAHLHESAWSMMRADFSLEQPNNPNVTRQIQFLTKRKDIIEDATRRAPWFLYHVVHECQLRDLPTELALIPMIESEFNPFAHSKAGASGMWQMMPSTASGLRLSISWWNDERRDVIKSTHAALTYLSYLKKNLGSWEYAIAAYDAGEGRIRRLLKKHPQGVSVWDLPLPQETQRYLVKIFAARAIILDPNAYQVNLHHVPAKPYFATIKTRNHIDIDALAHDLHVSEKDFRALNASHRRLSTEKNKLTDFYVPITHYSHAKKLLDSPRNSNHLIYKVKPNDSLHSIAKKLGCTTQFIKKVNHLKKDIVTVGQQIIVNRAHTRSVADHKTISADTVPGPTQHFHHVKKGDSLYTIAKKYGVTSHAIIYWNQLKSKKISTNACLTIWTNSNKSYHIVKKGDTLSRIAMLNNTTVNNIQEANSMTHSNIRIGQKISLPK